MTILAIIAGLILLALCIAGLWASAQEFDH